MVWLDSCESFVGTDRPEIGNDGEAPKRRIRLQPFGMARVAVTNAAFFAFVADTGYRTDAERFGWSYVFRGLLEEEIGSSPEEAPWWAAIEGASWRAPFGPESSFEDLPSHPVTHISGRDAAAYAAWAGGRLPTKAEWEHAARGGLADPRYPWGDAEPDDRTIFCNIWQGAFPEHNTKLDDHYGTAPVDAFEPNGFGLFNMSGNVWEWCADRYRVRSIGKAARQRNKQAMKERELVLKGGSYLCHRSYCWRYRIAARTGRSADI